MEQVQKKSKTELIEIWKALIILKKNEIEQQQQIAAQGAEIQRLKEQVAQLQHAHQTHPEQLQSRFREIFGNEP